MKKIIILMGAIAAPLIYASCNKTKINTNRLDGGEWKITELSVDGVNEAEFPHWNISECDAYDETCMGEWINHHGNIVKFAWQFRDKGKTFEISNQSTFEEATAGLTGHDYLEAEENLEQCQNFSGVYGVVKRKKTSMEFKTSSSIGFPGKLVVIKIEKE